MTEVRLAAASDCEAIARIKVIGWASTYAAMVAPEALAPHLDTARQLLAITDTVAVATNLVLVAERDGLVVGFAICVTTNEGPYLDSLHVLPEYRDRRVGRQLLRDLARRLSALGHTSSPPRGRGQCQGARVLRTAGRPTLRQRPRGMGTRGGRGGRLPLG
jgi:GNAT superfamily N-acetyltransferase